MSLVEVTFRQGSVADLPRTFALSERAIHDRAASQGIVPAEPAPTEAEIRSHWLRQRPLVEFLAAQEGCFTICENAEGPVGYARTVRFGGMEQLTELMVSTDHQGRGIGRALLERCWPGAPTPELGRLVVATGAPADLTLYSSFGVMPITGHWHMRQRTELYLEHRSHEIERTEPMIHALGPDRAVDEWQRLEPDALEHERPLLHRFFARDRNCLAWVDGSEGRANALCWVSGEGQIGPAVADSSENLVPVVLAALDRVAQTQEPEHLSLFTTTISWWVLRRLRVLGFQVYWPSWIMCSIPLPGLDRYLPTRPPHVL